MPAKKRGKKKKPVGKQRRRAPRKPARRAPAPKQRRAAARAGTASKRLGDVAETVDVLMPELAARLAALEHMLIEKKLCGREDLLRARAFVDLRRGGA